MREIDKLLYVRIKKLFAISLLRTRNIGFIYQSIINRDNQVKPLERQVYFSKVIDHTNTSLLSVVYILWI
jgi:hypothetical protein